MISERSFTLQGKIIKVAPITATGTGIQFGVIYVQTEETGQDGQPKTATFGVECWGKALENVYPKAKEGEVVKIQGIIVSKTQQTRDGSRKFLTYSLRANFMIIDTAVDNDPVLPPEEPMLQGKAMPEISDDDLPF